MKKKLQKYLSGEHEGFSLVELIIVIAIMAILIGIVALAVIPYLNKSKESKDLSTLDTVASALTTAVAQTKITGSGDFVYGSASTTTDQKVENAMKTALGSSTPTLGSNAATAANAEIHCKYDATNNVIIAYAGATAGTAVLSGYDNETGYAANLTKTAGGTALAVGN
ncbi:MAG: prepilin-type N-terminal cleavage/methylation domain-containing protein [Lachnospiraceae bacterium]|nr:prepilin-type N-terminal cleavage/methylation domain-containing protein [Lachnospiraceae bacterium]